MYYLETLCPFLLPITSRGIARGKRHGCSRWQNKYFKWKNMIYGAPNVYIIVIL